MKSKLLPLIENFPNITEFRDLDGSNGTNRETGQTCQIPAINDYQAIKLWLNEYKLKKTTFRCYQKEAERLLLWCIKQRRKAFSSLDRQDFEMYFEFLNNPTPKEIWCTPKNKKNGKRGSDTWRPFSQKGLSQSAKQSAIAIINSLLQYLVCARYLSFNPISLIRSHIRKSIQSEGRKLQVISRILEPEEWQAMLNTLLSMPECSAHQKDEKERLRFIVAMLYLLGLRVNELVTHVWSSFRFIKKKWWFVVKGKGDKEGMIPVNTALLTEVKRYRKHFQYKTELPELEESSPIIFSWRTGEVMSDQSIRYIFKKWARLSAEMHFKDNPMKQKKLAKFSPHWLRHLCATMQNDAKISFGFIKANLRHGSDDTTRIYVHEADDARHEAMENLEFIIED